MKGTRRGRAASGFTLIEILVTVAIVAGLGLLAVVGYQEYTSRARAADILVKYDAIRSGVGSVVANQTDGDCAALARRFGDANLNDAYASLGYDFTPATGGGFRPVLTVCAKADAGALGVKVARGAHDTLARTGSMEAGAMLSDTVVAFSLPLTAGNKATCTTYTPAAASGGGAGCGGSPLLAAAASTTMAPAQPVIAPPLPAAPHQRQPVAQTAPPEPPAQSAPKPIPLPRPSEVLACGDRATQTPCNDLDLVLAATIRCPADQPFAMNEIIKIGRDVMEFRGCASPAQCRAASTATTGPSNPRCARFDPATPGDVTCALCCYGDGCNIDTNPPPRTLFRQEEATGWRLQDYPR